MVLLESTNVPLGSSAPNFANLPSVDGKQYQLTDFADKQILIVIFMCNHCPYVQAIIERLVSLQADYKDKNLQIIGINPNDAVKYPDDSLEKMKEFAQEKNVNFIYVRDDSQEVAKAYKAQCTPDIFVYNENRALIYHGRLDDNWKDESQVTEQDLRSAIDLYLNTKDVVEKQIPSMGCSIKWLS